MTRDEVINGLERCMGKISCNGCPLECAEGDCALTLLSDALALLKAEPKRGRWIIEDSRFARQMVLCSECGNGSFRGLTRYCPNCGTRMETGT